MEKKRNAHGMWLRGEQSQPETDLEPMPVAVALDAASSWDSSTKCLEAIRDALAARGRANEQTDASVSTVDRS